MTRLSTIILAAALALAWSFVYGVDAADAVTLSDPYSRAVPPGQPNGIVFLELVNSSGENHALVGGETDAAEAVELHTHLMEGGMMKMRQVERIDLPPNSKVSLEPGGLHLMLIGLKNQLEPDQTIELTLVFEDHTRLLARVPVRKVEAASVAEDGRRKCGDGRCGAGRCGGGK